MKKIVPVYFILLFLVQLTFAQSPILNNNATISILTVGPGKNLSDKFGHSGFRIKNGRQDIVFGYGQYPFNDPNFILNFARGKLNYSMDAVEFKRFYYVYTSYLNREISEQVLNLNTAQKQKLYTYLLNNYKPENREYLYDFFFDNCATKIRDITNVTLNDKIVFNTPKDYSNKTFRTLIQDELSRNSWGSFGIDLALGSKIDQVAPANDHMFLPKNIYSFFETATINNKPLVIKTKELYKSKPENNSTLLHSLTGPFMVMSLLAVLILFITYKNYKTQTISRALDISIFSITGLIGVFILLLWFATDHEMTAHNYNVLWAMPLNLLALKNLIQRKYSIRFSKYLLFLILMLSLMFMHWIVGVQRFAPALLPLIIALYIRFIYVMLYTKKQLRS